MQYLDSSLLHVCLSYFHGDRKKGARIGVVPSYLKPWLPVLPRFFSTRVARMLSWELKIACQAAGLCRVIGLTINF